MRYRLMATYRGVPYEAGIGPSETDVVLFAACPPPEELGFEPATGHWRKELGIEDVQALWESRPTGAFRGEQCVVLDDLGDRLHIAYLGHDAYQAEQLGYWQVDRGVFELVTPREEVTEIVEERTDYPGRSSAPAQRPADSPGGFTGLPEPVQADGAGLAPLAPAGAPQPNGTSTRLADLAAATLAHLASMSAPGRELDEGPGWDNGHAPQLPGGSGEFSRSGSGIPADYPGAPGPGGSPGPGGLQGPGGSQGPGRWPSAVPDGSQVEMPAPVQEALPLEAAARRAASAATAAMRRQRQEKSQPQAADPTAGPTGPAGPAAAPASTAQALPVQAAVGQGAIQQDPVQQGTIQQGPAMQAPGAQAPIPQAPATPNIQAPAAQDPQASGQAPLTQGQVAQAPSAQGPGVQGSANHPPVTQAPAPQVPVALGAPVAPGPALPLSTAATANGTVIHSMHGAAIATADPVAPDLAAPNPAAPGRAPQGPSPQGPSPQDPTPQGPTPPLQGLATPGLIPADLAGPQTAEPALGGLPVREPQITQQPANGTAASGMHPAGPHLAGPMLAPHQFNGMQAGEPQAPGLPANGTPASEPPRRRRGARKRIATQRIFSELATLAAIPPTAYAVGEEIEGAMCLLKTEHGFEVFNAVGGARHEVRTFHDEESAYFYLFGVLAADAVRTGRLAPQPG